MSSNAFGNLTEEVRQLRPTWESRVRFNNGGQHATTTGYAAGDDVGDRKLPSPLTAMTTTMLRYHPVVTWNRHHRMWVDALALAVALAVAVAVAVDKYKPICRQVQTDLYHLYSPSLLKLYQTTYDSTVLHCVQADTALAVYSPTLTVQSLTIAFSSTVAPTTVVPKKSLSD